MWGGVRPAAQAWIMTFAYHLPHIHTPPTAKTMGQASPTPRPNGQRTRVRPSSTGLPIRPT